MFSKAAQFLLLSALVGSSQAFSGASLPSARTAVAGTGVLANPLHHKQPDQYSPHALQQMQLLEHLQGPTFHVDASPKPADLSRITQAMVALTAE